MNIKEAKEEIKQTILAYTARTESGTYRIPTVRQRPVLLMGPPGIGKTAIMEQVAQECGLGLVAYTMTHHTRQSAIGLPMIEKKVFDGREYAVTDYTMSEILAAVYEQMERTGCREGILFLDEINCVSETLMPALLQFLQYKTFGTHKLPEGWIVAAAGNPARYNQSVRDLDTATLDRVKWIEIEPDLPVWKSYARNQGLHPAILSFLEWRPESFYAVQTDSRGRGFVTARGWEDLSRMLLTLEELGEPVTERLPGQYLQQEEVAREFWIYYQLYCRCRELPYEKMRELPFDERLCMLQLMLQRIYHLADSWWNAGELLQSLMYFLEGCQRQAQTAAAAGGKTDTEKLLSVCKEQLAKRQQGIQVRKECGILPAAEEEKEAQLAGEIRRQMGLWRLSGDAEQAEILTERSGQRKQLETELTALLTESSDFMERGFRGRQEQFLFSLGLLEQKHTEAFLKQKLPKLQKSLEKVTNLDDAAAELETALS